MLLPMKTQSKPHPIRIWRLMNGERRLLETATKLGISESYLCLLERGKRPISAEMAVKVEKKLGIPRAELRPDLWKGA